MAEDLELSCRCGEVKAVARAMSPKRGTRAVCYCRSCRAFAHFLECAEDALVEHGGTDIFLTTPALLEFTAGRDRLACVRLTSQGPLRWYTTCCKTPLGSTMSRPGVPFLGLLPRLLLRDADENRLDSVFGPVKAAVFTEFASTANKQQLANRGRTGVLSMLAIGRRMLGGRLRGEHRRSAFLDSQTGAPLVEPVVLSEAARAALFDNL